jgi:ankyrin repeat protein
MGSEMFLLWKKILTVIIIGAFIGPMLGCGESKLGNKTIDETFANPEVAGMLKAAVNGDYDVLSQYIANGSDVNAVGHGGATPLYWLLVKDKLKASEILLQAGAKSSQKIARGYSALSMVVAGNQPKVLKLLLKYNADINTFGPKNMPLIEVAVLHRKWNHFDLLLDAGADINHHSRYGISAATTASSLGRFDKVIYMLERGYSYDLNRLGRMVQRRRVDESSEACTWKRKLVVELKKRDVVFKPIVRRHKKNHYDPCL